MLALGFWQYFSILNYALAAWAIMTILRRPREPRAMWAWILAILLLPVLGLILFAMIGQLKIERTRRKRHRRRRKLGRPIARRVDDTSAARTPFGEPQVQDLVHLATRLCGSPPTRGNDVTIFNDAEAFFLALRMAIQAARSYVHLEYYIIQPDETGLAIAEVLVDRAADGVRCRLLIDDVGSWRLPRAFVARLRAGGVEVAFFSQVIPWRGRWLANFRNHRKLVVIDGEIGFTGSQNIGDEYRGRLRELGPWRDTNLSIRGPAVAQLQEVFIEDWYFTVQQEIPSPPPPREPASAGPSIVHIIPSGPDTPADVLHQLLFAAIAASRRSVCVATPYFVPDATMILALQSAAYRGVRVRLLIPSRTDHRFVLWAGRSYYHDLVHAGVEIYEYPHGMLHAKVVVVDESWAMAGSANMDARSFKLNFELTSILYDRPLAERFQSEFNNLQAAARRVLPADPRRQGLRESLSLGLARLASPLL